MKKNKISKNWVNRQRRDIFVRQSKIDGYRARSVYKLEEINNKFKIFKSGISVLDIGAAPGSWSQLASKSIKNGKIISIDLKKIFNQGYVAILIGMTFSIVSLVSVTFLIFILGLNVL